MKMVKCKNCGTEYSQQITYRCPKCGSMVIVKKNAAKPIIIIVCIFVAIFMIAGISNVLNEDNSSTQTSGETSTVSSNDDISSESKKDTQKVIYSDSNIKVSYIKLSEASNYGVNVTACYIHLKVENISSQTFNVTLTDAYANDSSVTVMSGLPMKLAPGKNSQAPFTFGYNNVVSSVDEIEKLEFKIALYDEDFTKVIATSKNIVIEP